LHLEFSKGPFVSRNINVGLIVHSHLSTERDS